MGNINPWLWFIFIFLPAVVQIHVFALEDLDDRSIEEQCSLQCPFQNKTSTDVSSSTDSECGSQCNIGQCSRGCEAWRSALQSNCQDVCNGTQDLLPQRELYCVMGCNYAINLYFERLRDKMGTPPTPALVADSLTATSLSLEWGEAQGQHGGHPRNTTLYRVQWRYEEVSTSSWIYCRNQSWEAGTSRRLERLQPYTKYRFRLAALVSRHPAAAQMVVVSAPSVVIGTLPQGLPASPPMRVRAAAVDATHISVTWVPGPFPHGPVLSFVLHLSEVASPSSPPSHQLFSAIKDIPAVEQHQYYSYMYQNVPPNRNYVLRLSTRNKRGAGPAAITYISTPKAQAKEKLQPVLLLGTRHSVIRQGSDMVDEPHTIFTSVPAIYGLAVHVRLGLLYVSDSAGNVGRLSLSAPQPPQLQVILEPNSLGLQPRELSVDWLNDLLYVVGEVRRGGPSQTVSKAPKWQVVRCRLDGSGLTVAVAGFHSRPLHLQVDPYNGYLFWVMQGPSMRSGLYRLDLSDVSNGVRHEARPELILEHRSLGAFTVDHANFRLLVADQANNTVLEVSLDGKEVVNVRLNTQKPMFTSVLSLATSDGLFYWTNGTYVLAEEYHKGHYFHNIFPQVASHAFFTLAVLLPGAQPIPVPVNPPSGLQAVLGNKAAKVSWQAPHLLGGQGKGAWQNWSYEVQLRDETRGTVVLKNEVGASSVTLTPLLPDTRYVLKVCAYTSAGHGPCSAEFSGRSFRAPRPGQREAAIVWGAAEGLVQTDTTGDGVETLIQAESLKDSLGAIHIAGVAWYEDLLYLATNASHTLWFNLTSHTMGHVHGVDSAGSIAVDWLGKRLYWSNPKQHLITRGSLTGDNQEPLPILSVAKELHIDSLNAFLYWSTGHAVECARLNGQHRHIYYPANFFSGKQVMGLTLDPERGSVFWIVRSHEGSQLYRAPMATDKTPMPPVISAQGVKAEITSLMHPVVQGPLCYFSDHLLWLQDGNNAVISDLTGQGAAVISGLGLSALNVLAVIDSSRQLQPSGRPMSVIPESVNQDSLQLAGSWDTFNVSWSPVKNVNYGRVFYELKIWELSSQQEISLQTDAPWIQYPRNLTPHSQLEISVRAFTYWGTSTGGRSAPKRLHTPSAPPSAATSPRVFISFERDSPLSITNKIEAKFRWNEPAVPNGELEYYRVQVCLDGRDCHDASLDANQSEFTAQHLLQNSSYSFQVWAGTDAGEGAGSELVWADTGYESPIPQLLVATNDALKLTDCDRLSGPELSLSTIVRGEAMLTVVYLALDGKLFWISSEGRNLLMSCRLDGTNLTKVAALNGSGTCLTLDWVARRLYWAEQEEGRLGSESTLVSLDIDHLHTTKVFSRPAPIISIQVSPLTSALYWVETEQNGEGKLMTSRLDGQDVHPFFSDDSRCHCPYSSVMGSTLAFDATRERLLWSDAKYGHIVSAELDACHCRVLVNASRHAGLPATTLTCDQRYLYWSDGAEGRVFSALQELDNNSELSEMGKEEIVALPLTGAKLLSALGTRLQPFPEAECLLPFTSSKTLEVELVSRSPQTLSLRMPQMSGKEGKVCKNVSLPTLHYHLYYAPTPCLVDLVETQCRPTSLEYCSSMDTYDNIVDIFKLNPYSCYVVFASVGNFYMDILNLKPIFGKPMIFQTEPGAPSEPRNVRVALLNPWSVRVMWAPPLHLHGADVRYEVLWSSEGTQASRQIAGAELQQKGTYQIILERMSSAQTYLIWVRAYSQSTVQQYSESDRVKVHTLPEPEDIILLQATPYTLNVSWPSEPYNENPGHLAILARLQMLVVQGSNQWINVPETSPGSRQYLSRDLYPKTMYQFRVSLTYPEAKEPFTWPQDNRFTFETLGDRPSTPGTPQVLRLRLHVYQVNWEPSRDHGAPVEMYLLEGRAGGPPSSMDDNAITSAGTLEKLRSSREAPTNVTRMPDLEPTRSSDEWNLFYNGSETYWIISTELTPRVKYSFRACARNAYGVSAWSSASEVFDWSETALLADQQRLGLVLGTAIPAVIFAAILGVLLALYICRLRDTEKKALQISRNPVGHRRPDLELATLRETPRGRGGRPVIQHNNAIYNSTSGSGVTSGTNTERLLLPPTDEEVAALPRIRRDQITLTKFLGSGAFGEVFEGLARQLPGGQERVAVKTLQKGASEQEKGEFLKEAQLMSNFRHEHILQLLGVCLDNDPNFIILELMEGGDLLSYLRSSRPLATSGSLTLLDLVAICVDVARGCKYLEEMHFVHRDLACRNCLVSFAEGVRTVKIGDFGLARDIYKSDYYRKNGEGLLPVRWMAPESLMDGVFTSQSDAWAFGVIIWEILTLGQQPYPARTNLEVLHYVRSGGRLVRPSKCPDELNQLMTKCWSYSPEGRPTFKHCLEVLETLLVKMEAEPSTAALDAHYIGQASYHGMENLGFFADDSMSGDTPVKIDDEPGLLAGAVTVSLPPEQDSGFDVNAHIPKYLELIHEPCDYVGNTASATSPTTSADGYEMPRVLPQWSPETTRPRASSVGVYKRMTSLDKRLSDPPVPYMNVSQPLLVENTLLRTQDDSGNASEASELERMVSSPEETNV